MKDRQQALDRLYSDVAAGTMTRRDIVKTGFALGLSLAAIGPLVAQAQDATPAAPVSPAANGPVNVPIVGKDITLDDIKAAIAAEGSVTVGNWTYAANDQLIKRFQDYIKTVYGEDITLNYVGSQSPSTYLADLYTALQAGNASPYDVLAIEENYWAQVQADGKAQNKKFMEDYLPSGLIPNADRVFDNLKHAPTSVGFQASATPGINYNSKTVDFLTDWKDLADERLKGKLLLWLPSDITAGAMLLGMCNSLGLDYHNPDHVTQAIDFIIEKVTPNAIKYTADNAEAQSLFKSGAVDVVTFWNSMARLQYLDGMDSASFLVASSGQYAVNGFMWIPVQPAHPVLAQIFIDWRLSDDAQFPDLDAWGITEGMWAELQEGFMGPSYEGLVPDWIADVYFNFYPTTEQLSKSYQSVDWDYYTANSADWFDYWNQKLGL
ncbi:MAG TPA: PotD/PotF family extracellular solute-binding protein [Thermomicrobiales bacterium]|nr:PotD/PotF family extracellular solute-binding protein [Thermomicrobiales bacterium]